jgi:hypothetical protein
VHGDRVPVGQAAQTVGKLRGRGQCRPVDQDGKHHKIGDERRLDLHADRVVRLLQPPSAVFVGSRRPTPADDDEHGVAPGHDPADLVSKVATGVNRVNVHEHVAGVIARAQLRVDGRRRSCAIGAPVAQEDPRPAAQLREAAEPQHRDRGEYPYHSAHGQPRDLLTTRDGAKDQTECGQDRGVPDENSCGREPSAQPGGLDHDEETGRSHQESEESRRVTTAEPAEEEVVEGREERG